MPENPAITLYRTWDNLFRLTLSQRQTRLLANKLPTHTHVGMNERPYTYNAWGAPAHIINHRTGIQPVAQDADGAYIYSMGYLSSRKVSEPLFQIDARGNFRLGSAFMGYCTRGAYERVQEHTFLGTNRTYGSNSERIWWFRGFGGDQVWCNPREWRRHTYYWCQRSVPPKTWLLLMQVGGAWRIDLCGANENYADVRPRLLREYKAAEDYYAKWRRKYFRENGIPDPQQPLDASEVETIDYIAQHLRVYEPPKARLPT